MRNGIFYSNRPNAHRIGGDFELSPSLLRYVGTLRGRGDEMKNLEIAAG